MKGLKHLSIWISVALYVACLGLPAYYSGSTHDSAISLGLLMIGFLGPFFGHYSWFANLFYLFALIFFGKPKLSALLGVLALILGLSFLFHSQISFGEGGPVRIIGYGYGYYLWIMAIGLIPIGQFLKVYFEEPSREGTVFKTIFFLSWVGGCTSVFMHHFYSESESQYSFEKKRNQIFSASCKSAKYAIYIKDEKTDSIFFDPDWGVEIKKNRYGWHMDSGGVVSLGVINSGMIKFYETADRDFSQTGKYLRFYLKDYKGLGVDVLESKHAVITEVKKLGKNLRITESHVIIKNFKTNEVIAETKYVFDAMNGRFCNGIEDITHFSTSIFVSEVLNLKKEYASAYD